MVSHVLGGPSLVDSHPAAATAMSVKKDDAEGAGSKNDYQRGDDIHERLIGDVDLSAARSHGLLIKQLACSEGSSSGSGSGNSRSSSSRAYTSGTCTKRRLAGC